MYSALCFVQSSTFFSDKAVWEEQRELTLRALAFESEPCTMFSESSSAKSPRIVPGAESSGFVVPIMVRTTEIADSPLTASARTGPELMKSTSPLKNGFPVCSA